MRLVSAHYKQHIKSNMSCTDLRNFVALKVVININPIGEMKSIMKPNCRLCMEEMLTILKKLHDKNITLMSKN